VTLRNYDSFPKFHQYKKFEYTKRVVNVKSVKKSGIGLVYFEDGTVEVVRTEWAD